MMQLDGILLVDAVAIELARYDLGIGLRFKQEFFSGGPWVAGATTLRQLQMYWEMKFYTRASAMFMSTASTLPNTDNAVEWLHAFSNNVAGLAAGTIHWS